MTLLLMIPLLGGLAFPLFTSWLSRAMEDTRDPWGILLVLNLCTALVFLPPFLLLDPDFSTGPFYQPLLCAAFFFIGQVAAYKSFTDGDLSVAVPLQGTKVLLVALLALIFLGQAAGWNIWVAAALIPVAIYFLREHPPGKREDRKYRWTFFLASVAALAFAALDVGVQAWSPGWGVWRFGFWTFVFQAAFSLSLYFLPGRARRFRYKPGIWGPALGGSLGMALVTLGLVCVISVSGRAAWVNILFNSRVLWSVVFVWAAGRWFNDPEARRAGGGRTLTLRLVGSLLMMVSIILAVMK
jgi:drug/metabolite transporter (DMT)-like permease